MKPSFQSRTFLVRTIHTLICYLFLLKTCKPGRRKHERKHKRKHKKRKWFLFLCLRYGLRCCVARVNRDNASISRSVRKQKEVTSCQRNVYLLGAPHFGFTHAPVYVMLVARINNLMFMLASYI